MNMNKPVTPSRIVKAIVKEIKRANTIHEHQKTFNSPAEALGVIREEYKEFEEEVFKYKSGQPQSNMCIELIQIAAMCVKTILSFWGKNGR